jgi:translation initiation factor IF-2
LLEDVVSCESKITTATRFKEEVAELTTGRACRMAFVGYQDLYEGDLI